MQNVYVIAEHLVVSIPESGTGLLRIDVVRSQALVSRLTQWLDRST